MGKLVESNLPKDVIFGMPVVTAVGNCEVHIENFQSIMEYNAHILRLKTKGGSLAVCGKRLVICYFNAEEIHIRGVIDEVVLPGGGMEA